VKLDQANLLAAEKRKDYMGSHFVISYCTKDGSSETVKVDQPTANMGQAAVMDLWDFDKILSVSTAPTLEEGLVRCEGYTLKIDHSDYDLSISNVHKSGDQVFAVYPDLDTLRAFINEHVEVIRREREVVRQAATEIEAIAQRFGVTIPVGQTMRCIRAGLRITEFNYGLQYGVTGKGPVAFEELIREIRITPAGVFVPIQGETQWRIDIQL